MNKRNYLVMLAAVMLVGCGGGGGDDSAPGKPPVAVVPPIETAPPVKVSPPIVPQATSYLNAKNLGIASQRMPVFAGVAGQYGEGATGGVAFGDFLQTGSYGLVVFTNRWNHDSSKANSAGAVHFYQYVNGAPVDVTSKLLSDTTGCISPRRLLVADFNGDKRPDVFAACHGAEFGPYASWAGEESRLLLSQADGTYRNVVAPVNGYVHGASAGDINGDGYVDVVLSDMNAARDYKSSIVALMNDGTGNFAVKRADEVEFIAPAANYMDGDKRYYNAFLTVELIDLDGDNVLDLFLASNEKTQATLILKGAGNGTFMRVNKQFQLGTADMQILDVVYTNNSLFLLADQANATGLSKITVRRVAADYSRYDVVNEQLNGSADNPIFMMPSNNVLVPYDAARSLRVGL